MEAEIDQTLSGVVREDTADRGDHTVDNVAQRSRRSDVSFLQVDSTSERALLARGPESAFLWGTDFGANVVRVGDRSN